MVAVPAQLDPRFMEAARSEEVAIFSRLFLWCCLAVVVVTALPALLIDPAKTQYSDLIRYWNISLGAMAGLCALLWVSTSHPNRARAALVLGGVLVSLIAFGSILLVYETQDPAHASAGMIAMLGVTLTYPRWFGVVAIVLPQWLAMLWLAATNNWADNWLLGLFLITAAAAVATLVFIARGQYFRRLRALYAERLAMHEALQQRSVEHAELLQRLLTEQKFTTLGRLAAGIAHDFNNMLVPIMGNAALLEETTTSASQQGQVQEIIRAAGRARRLTQQLGGFAGRGPSGIETYELNLEMSELVAFVWRAFPEHVEIEWQPAASEVYIKGNRTEIHQTLMNLLLSSGEAAPEGTNVLLALRSDVTEAVDEPEVQNMCCIEIIDQGTPEETDHRAIAIAAAASAVRNWSGKLKIMPMPDRRPNAGSKTGTRISLYLPKAATPLPAVGTSTSVSDASHPDNVELLVVDDEHAVRRVTVQLLRRSGYRVREVDSGEQALVAIAQAVPSLVIMDLRMPGMGGRAAIEAIRTEHPSMPIIVCTGYEGDAKDWLNQASQIETLLKPYAAKDLIELVRRSLLPAANLA